MSRDRASEYERIAKRYETFARDPNNPTGLDSPNPIFAASQLREVADRVRRMHEKSSLAN